MKKIALVLLFAITACALFAGGAKETATPAKGGVKHVAVIIKATDSDFWQYVLVGANNYGKEHPDKVRITTHGPASEADIDKQVAILEDVISSKPDAIVISSTSSDATVPAIEKAAAAGIPVVTIDNKVKTDKVVTLLATDNKKGGALCADKLVEGLKAKNIPLKGKVGMISAMAGVQVLTDRDEGFLTRMKEIAPDLQVLPVRYIDNDILKGLAATEDILTANPDIVGFFGDNNHSGDGVARAIRERKLQDKIVAVAYDSDPEEVQALKDGILYALIVQDPYGMGYKGVDTALRALAGEKFPPYIDTGCSAVTKANMDSPEMKGLLDPMSLKK
ncbi:MAG TPA: ABC transporter substrate-binding protein [Spirochaetia bacterium]|nr:ABC transporter substrate-binding protein [Spirochaetia bacterium]